MTREVQRLLAVLDASYRLGDRGEFSLGVEGTLSQERKLVVHKFVEEVATAISMRLEQQALKGAKFDSRTMGFVVATGLHEGLKVLFNRADELERTEAANRSLDALEAQQSLEASKAGSHRR